MENMNPHTSAVYQQAHDTIRDEMAKHAKDGAISILGEFFTELLAQRPEIAEKLIADKKSLHGGMEAMKAYASKYKNGSWAAVDFFTGINIVLEYYGLEKMEPCQIMAVAMRAGNMPEIVPETEVYGKVCTPSTATADATDIDALFAELGI